MTHHATVLLLSAMMIVPASGQNFKYARDNNATRDAARAKERQARTLERLNSQLRDQALREDRAQRNYERDSRSLRRFDRP
jgi:hypothetical protein